MSKVIEQSNWFQLNSPTVVCDVVDEEVVLVNLESGDYYSIEQVGATIWQYLHQGRSVGEVITAVSDHYLTDTDEIEKNVHALIDQLLNEGLVVAGNGTPPVIQNGLLNTSGHPQRKPFSGVILHKFNDMKDLLLLDPVHEVNEMGWPHASQQQ